jgi:tetratricopeptide (TPR) repeat protein
MNAARLNELLARPGAMSAEDLGALENLCRDFPAFGLPYFLLARAYHDRNDYRYKETLHAAALRCPDRIWLRDFMEGRLEKQAAPAEEETKVVISPEPGEISVAQVPEESASGETTAPADEVPVSVPAALNSEKEPEAPTEVRENATEREESAELQETEPAAVLQVIPEAVSPPVQTETNVNPVQEETKPAPPVADKPWRRRHVDPAAMTVYSIEDHFPPAEQPLEHEGVRDFFAWLRNPAKSEDKPAPEPDNKEDKDLIIQRFLETRPSVSRPKKEFFNPVNMARKSEQEDPELVTETLATIYWKQGNTDKAIAMFEKLILKYPGKRPYFAALIQKIRQENES